MINCDFNNPVNYLGEPATADELWQFQNATCDNEMYVMIEDSTRDARFYLDKSLSYGDILTLIFLTIFIFWGISNFLFNYYFIRKRK